KLDLKTVLVRNWIKGEVDCTGDYYLIVGIGFVSAFSDGSGYWSVEVYLFRFNQLLQQRYNQWYPATRAISPYF
uniref:hypothetical protein n=1 Tax=Umezakia ovalisporum TaxID=75695 RepID=UPI0039C644F6